jgi:hypothetical protein
MKSGTDFKWASKKKQSTEGKNSSRLHGRTIQNTAIFILTKLTTNPE